MNKHHSGGQSIPWSCKRLQLSLPLPDSVSRGLLSSTALLSSHDPSAIPAGEVFFKGTSLHISANSFWPIKCIFQKKAVLAGSANYLSSLFISLLEFLAGSANYLSSLLISLLEFLNCSTDTSESVFYRVSGKTFQVHWAAAMSARQSIIHQFVSMKWNMLNLKRTS